MIDIHYDGQNHCLRLKGHAGAGAPGQDLVCCAASILVYTMAANVRRMQAQGWLRDAQIRMAPGDARIACRSKKEVSDRVDARLDAICLGFWMLEKEYPEFVTFTVS